MQAGQNTIIINYQSILCIILFYYVPVCTCIIHKHIKYPTILPIFILLTYKRALGFVLMPDT